MSSTGLLSERPEDVSAEYFLPLPTLNDDCLVEIFKHLPLRKRIWLEQFCRHWRNDVVPESLRNVKSLELEDFQMNWTKWRSSGTYSCLTGSEIFRKMIDRIGNQLEVISIVSFAKNDSSPCQFDIPELTLLSSQCPNLKNLVLAGDNVDVTAAVFELLGTELSGLENLSILNYRWSDAIEQNLSISVGLMTRLKELSVEPKCGYSRGTFLRHLPNSVISVNVGINGVLGMSDLADFIRSHPGLKKFQLSKRFWDWNFDQTCREAIGLLSQHCGQLEELQLRPDPLSYGGGKLADDRFFSDHFESLTHLKKVKFDWRLSFNTATLQSLCANCPQLEDLAISLDQSEDFTLEATVCVGQLRKLKRLSLNLALPNDWHMDALLSGIGATLNYLDIHRAQVTDASLLPIGLKCSRLAHLVLEKDEKITSEGLQRLIDAIVNQESWNDPLKSRRLRIDVFVKADWADWLAEIDLKRYKGRVKINQFRHG